MLHVLVVKKQHYSTYNSVWNGLPFRRAFPGLSKVVHVHASMYYALKKDQENMFVMKRPTLLRASILLVVALFALLSLLTGTVAVSSRAYAAVTGGKLDVSRLYDARPLWKEAKPLSSGGGGGGGGSSLLIPPCLASATPPRCYSPQQLRKAYGIQPLLARGISGKGRTIVLVDGSSSPTLLADVHLYDLIYSLKDPKLNVIAPNGMPPFDPNAYAETALDVEIAHTIAPDATIDLVLGDTSQAKTFQDFLVSLLKATRYAVDHNLGDVISQSYGVGESCVDASYIKAEQETFQAARAKHITVLASSGDYGDGVITCNGNNTTLARGVNIPASDPLLTSVGGTTLDATLGQGRYVGEVTWNGWDAGGGATGGGISTIFPRPRYQSSVSRSKMRALPDVAFDADPATGVPVVLSVYGATYITPFGGTSVGSPAWAGIVALANQAVGTRLGFLNDALYALAKSAQYPKAFHDILAGNNTITLYDDKGNPYKVPGYVAGPGWDAVTGVGTPKVANLVALLAPACGSK